MINRDFSLPRKNYFKQNKFVLIALGVLVLMGLIMMCVFGFNGGAEIKGYNTFNVNMNREVSASKLDDYTREVKMALADYKADLYTVQLSGEGDQTVLIVKYFGKVKNHDAFNSSISNSLDVEIGDISVHNKVGPSVGARDYIYTFACGLTIVTLFAIYVGFRYNWACSISSIVGAFMSFVLLLSLTAIFRLTIENSFLFINIATILLGLIECLMLFDGLERERSNMKDKDDRSTQLANTLKANAFRQKVFYASIFLISLLFIFIAPSAIKQVSLVMMFALVVAMFVGVYVLPFVWCLTITQVNDKIRVKKDKKVKKTVEDNTSIEGEDDYTENKVVEVKEGGDDNTPSQDENIVIE